MPSKTQDGERSLDGDEMKSRDKRRHKHSRSKRKSSSQEKDTAAPERSSTLTSSSARQRASPPMPEIQRPASSSSPRGSKSNLPYPTFSKAHSKEAVGSREDFVSPKSNLLTPDPTDIDRTKDIPLVRDCRDVSGLRDGPPSPPLTAVDPTGSEPHKLVNDKKRDSTTRKTSSNGRLTKGPPPRSTASRSSPWRSSRDREASPVSPSRRSKPSTPVRTIPLPVTVDDASSTTSLRKPRSTSPATSLRSRNGDPADSLPGSNSTIAPKQPTLQRSFTPNVEDESPPVTDPDSSPKTPTPRGTPFSPSRKGTLAHPFIVNVGPEMGNGDSPMPPPPPPPPAVPFTIPRVDYLMQHGGLVHPVPKTFLTAAQPSKDLHTAYQSIPPSTMSSHVNKFFAPFNGLLDDYTKVVSKNGSLAVATGYRSIARRLLDRLEAVFARDISSEFCTCFMCQSMPDNNENIEDQKSISWGEILEYVCGRQELPLWPAFTLDNTAIGLGISASENRLPMQKLDIDVPAEYRDHYIRQSKKTKQSVDNWLAGQVETPCSPPQDVDDDTLTFAMLTHLDSDQKGALTSFLGILPSRPGSVAPGVRSATPASVPRSELLSKTGLAIQRLYRLAAPPREPECAMYLLKNPPLHNVVATLAAVSDGEWEILTSGRFDGFLRSGAEDNEALGVPSRGPTPGIGRIARGPTPGLRSGTPATGTAGAPVAIDEETEVAVLAEVEREIYLGMEALEDAFEALHCKAEAVRRSLRERGAGLAMAGQARRGDPNGLEARLGTPASVSGSAMGFHGWESETDDGIDDAMSELAPDDSASNVSSSRHRRPKRRNERRTPAPVEEEDEYSELEGSRMTKR